ncbi:sortase [Candidatus Parcubacteria bacterium]|nr:sortase [Candidatus Parcubacteria bacterium]
MFQINPDQKNYFKIGILLILVGFLGFMIPFLSIGFAREESFIQKFEQTNAKPASATPLVSPTPTLDPNANNVKNRLVIPGANINMAIIESSSERALWRGGWLWPNGSTPDKGGNTIIFGHRFRYLPPVTNTLYNLDKASMNDEFYITWRGKEYHYRVSEIKIVNPKDIYILEQSSGAEVTLVTCFPLFSSKQRLVVIGTLIQ